MEPLELLEIIKLGEDSLHQFKKTIDRAASLAAEMAAFSNSSGGMIIVGVNDDSTIIGLTKEEIRKINNFISDASLNLIKNPINPLTENININDKILIIIHVKEGYDKPYFDNQGSIWVKSGANKRKVTSKEELRRLFQSSDLLHADEVPVRNSTINDIDKKYLDDFIQKNRLNFVLSEEIPFQSLLNNMNLARNAELNLAGLLLFGKNIERFKPQFCIKAVNFIGNSIGVQKYRDSEDISGKLHQQYNLAYAFLNRNLKKIQGKKSINSTGELEIPEIVVEELLVNALIHRNYFIDAPIKIFIFDDRIEIISPGGLPNKLTIENIKAGNSIIRNPIICSFASRILPYRGIGTGIPRALKEYNDIELINDLKNDLFIAKIGRIQ